MLSVEFVVLRIRRSEGVKLRTSLILLNTIDVERTTKVLQSEMPSPWTTPDQANWLQGRIPDFLKAQADKNLPRYFAKLYEEWFTKWSERDILFGSLAPDESLTVEQIKVLGEAVEKQQKVFSTSLACGIRFQVNPTSQRLKSYLNWHAVNHRQRQTASISNREVLQELAPRPRTLQESEIYCKMHYESKLKAIVGQRLSMNTEEITKGQQLKTIRKVAKECYELESEEVKSEVRAELSKQLRERQKAVEAMSKAERGTERTAEQYHAYVLLFFFFIAC
jgi:hypothetical protein